MVEICSKIGIKPKNHVKPKSKGDRESPWWTPVVLENHVEGCSLIRREKEAGEMNSR